MEDIRQTDLKIIDDNPYQTRQLHDRDHITSLAEDIKQNGLLQIPVGRFVDETGKMAISLFIEDYSHIRVQLAFGHNRRDAYKLLAQADPKFSKFPVIIRNLKDEEMAILAWSENESRKQLDPIERARAIQRFSTAFGWTQQTIAEKIRLDRSTVANLLRLLNLPDVIVSDIQLGLLSQRQALALLPVYELSVSQKFALDQNPGFCEFIGLARSGQINSDTLREKVQIYIDSVEHLNGRQLTFIDEQKTESVIDHSEIVNDAPVFENEPGETVENLADMAEKENDFESESVRVEEEKNSNVCAQTLEEKPENETAFQTQPASTEIKQQEISPEPIRVPEAASVSINDNSIVFSVTWNGSMAICGLRRGNGAPVIKMAYGLDYNGMPDVFVELREKLG
ncbi:MAG: ParB/RepB/Spo0J family partition protein [Anaerolineae bacterium]|nr:ParB/RepB/Spo0J family partition protein [Anaerolineae bacterium]